jgi:phthiodiolone/phenolphthiodiolone dimycocerosates ketoreductase
MSILRPVEFLVVTGASRGAVDEALNSPALKTLSLTASDDVCARHGARHPLRRILGFAGLDGPRLRRADGTVACR